MFDALLNGFCSATKSWLVDIALVVIGIVLLLVYFLATENPGILGGGVAALVLIPALWIIRGGLGCH